MIEAVFQEDLTIEPRVESDGHQGLPKSLLPLGSLPLMDQPAVFPIQKPPGSELQESTEVVDLGSPAIDIWRAIRNLISASVCLLFYFTVHTRHNCSPQKADMGGQNQQSPADQGDKQENVPPVSGCSCSVKFRDII